MSKPLSIIIPGSFKYLGKAGQLVHGFNSSYESQWNN